MQTTLLGLAVSLIVALVAALVGPHVVDWTRYRDGIEVEASRTLGTPVRITGQIEVSLLPTPSLGLGGVSLGEGDAQLSARGVRIELALGPLLRGDWRISELRLDAPQLRLGLDAEGRVRTPPVAADFDPDKLSIERLVVENGRAVLSDAASGGAITLEQLSFKGDVRSLVGPIRGEGAFVTAGGLYSARITAGRRAPDGSIKLRFALDPLDRPLTVETEGTLWLDAAGPRYEGTVNLARPAGAELADGRTLARDPWRLMGQMRARPGEIRIDQGEFQYGPEDRAVRLGGAAALLLDRSPRLAVSITSRQLELDRVLAVASARHLAVSFPAAVRTLLDALLPPIPAKLDVDIDAVTIGGAPLQNVRGTVSIDDSGWILEDVEARAPGLTQVHLGGRLAPDGAGLAFSGPTRVDVVDPRGLLGWIEGRADAQRGPIAPLHLHGDVSVAGGRLSVDGLVAEIEHKTVRGRFAYAAAAADRPARLDAALDAGEIDFGRSVELIRGLAGGTGLDWPRDIALALTAGKATYGTVEAKGVDARINLDAHGLTVERLVVADLRQARLEASGSIDTSASPPRGAVSLTLRAPRADGLTGLAAELLPDHAADIRRYGGSLGAADLRARLEVAPARPDAGAPDKPALTSATLTATGSVGAMRLNLTASGTGDPAAIGSARLKVSGNLDASDGAALAAMSGLDRWAAIEPRPASVAVMASGGIEGGVDFDLKLVAAGLSATAGGQVRRHDAVWSGRADVSVTAADARAFAAAGQPLPMALKARAAWSGEDLRLDNLSGQVGSVDVRGYLGGRLSSPMTVNGRLEASDIDAAPLLAAIFAVPHRAPRAGLPNEGLVFAADPFGRPAFAGLDGRIEFAARRADLLPGVAAHELTGAARLDGSSLILEGVTGKVAGGSFTAETDIRMVPDGLAMRTKMALVNGDLTQLTRAGGKTAPAAGLLSASAEVSGTGRSPAALIGSLHGDGAIAITRAQVAGLDPRAIEVGIRAAERGLPLERLAGYLGNNLDLGGLTVPEVRTTLTVADGRVRLGPLSTKREGVDVSLAATYDVAADDLDARFIFTGVAPADASSRQRPELAVLLRGSLGAPRRSVDSTALVSWVTLRLVEREAKRLEAAEGEAKRRDEQAVAERARQAREKAEQERRARETAVRPQTDPEPTASTRPTEPAAVRAPELSPPIEIRPRIVRPAAGGQAANPMPNGSPVQSSRPPAAKPPAEAVGQPPPEAQPPAPAQESRPFWRLFNWP